MKTMKHKQKSLYIQLLGKTRISASLCTIYAEYSAGNEREKKSQQILLRVIDTLKCCGKCNLPICKHKEN